MRIRYGGDANFAPFESLDSNGRAHGFQMDLLAELGAAVGLEFDITLKPWRETEADFKQGKLDLVAMVDTEHRRQWARFARGHATPALAFYHRQGERSPQGLSDLSGLRLAVLDSEAMRDTLSHWLAGAPGPFVRVSDAALALGAVQQGRADVALLPRAYADPVLASGTVPGVVPGTLSLGLQTYALAVQPGQQQLQTQLQLGLDQLEKTGRLEALRVRWLSSHREVAERNLLERELAQEQGWFWGVAGASTVTVAALIVGLRRRGRRIANERERRREAELSLQRAQALLDHAFGHNRDPMLIIERDSLRVSDANAALQTLVGSPSTNLIGKPLADLGQYVEIGVIEQLIHSFDSDGMLEAVPLKVRRNDGAMRDCLVTAEPLAVGAVAHVFCVLRDITEQLAQDASFLAAYQALDAARKSQARAEGRLQEFTREVAHDLKTPLHAVQGFAGLLMRRLQSGHVEEAQTYARHIERAAWRMNAMIDALSSLAQVSARPLRRDQVDMRTLVNEIAELLLATQPERRPSLKIGDLPHAQADPALVAQVWQNLLGNAIKYSALVPQPKIEVGSFRDERGTWYRVSDNGVGFDMSRAQSLFLPFQRMHSEQEFEGMGVGLSLVRRIVELHAGEVRLHSVPGEGTVADFTLDPVDPVDRPAPPDPK